MNLYLLRHCSTFDSENGINGSRTDIPLSMDGRKMAKSLVNKLNENNYDLIVISPLKRTYQTIDPYILTLETPPEIIVDELVIERDLGNLTNTVKGDGKIAQAISESGKNSIEWVPENGESTEMVFDRAVEFLSKIKNKKVENVLICSHQNFLRCLELAVLSIPLTEENFSGSNPSKLEPGELRKYQIPNSSNKSSNVDLLV